MKESQIQHAIMDYLAARHVLAFRMNTGGMAGEYNGKPRFMRFGVVGMADILAFTTTHTGERDYSGLNEITYSEPLWIEVKTATGKQSEFQRSFQRQVEGHGHRYLIARSVDDVEGFLGACTHLKGRR